MKILFVEDELAKNISRLCMLFEKYLGEKRIKQLQALDEDTSGYGARPEEIKEIVDSSQVINVEYSFPEALHRIMADLDEYSVFIVDRNLDKTSYTFDTVHDIDPEFSINLYEKYLEREGDYLFSKVMMREVEVMNSFFFLTAYTADQVIRNERLFEHYIDFNKFKKDNFIEKSNESDMKRLREKLKAFREITTLHTYREYFNILVKMTDKGTANTFLKVAHDKDDKKYSGDNLKNLRLVYESILQALLLRYPDVAMHCLDERGKLKSKGTDVPRILEENNHINSIIRSFMTAIWKIGSDFGSHRDPSIAVYAPTIHTVNALFLGLLDIIQWMKQSEYKNHKM